MNMTKENKDSKWIYDSSIQSSSMVSVKKKNSLYINGEWVEPRKGNYFDTINPATGETLAQVAIADKDDVNLAVKAARAAYENAWSSLSGKERGKYLFRIARILQERSREFAVLETLDGGKPIKESRDVDIPLAANHFFYYGGWADKLEFAFPASKIKPLGVCGQIIPWNFPLMMAAWKIAPALATGNTVVLKPAGTTPLTALLLADVFAEAGLPKGVVNILTGSGSITGKAIVDHKDIDKIAFTGSTSVGKKIASSTAQSNKKLTLELGGKSANIIFEDAAIDQAVEGVISGIYFNQGHVCCAGSRLLVQESIREVVVRKLKKRMEQLRVGNPLDKNTDIGAINSAEQLKKIQDLIALGKKEGGNFYETNCTLPEKGFFCRPCFFEGQTPSDTISRMEIFGPVLSIMTFRTPDEAVEMANDSHYGLAAGVWSEKSSKIHQVASSLKAGVIWANTYNKFDPSAPFGGYFESGWGREGGLQGLFPYLEVVQ